MPRSLGGLDLDRLFRASTQTVPAAFVLVGNYFDLLGNPRQVFRADGFVNAESDGLEATGPIPVDLANPCGISALGRVRVDSCDLHHVTTGANGDRCAPSRKSSIEDREPKTASLVHCGQLRSKQGHGVQGLKVASARALDGTIERDRSLTDYIIPVIRCHVFEFSHASKLRSREREHKGVSENDKRPVQPGRIVW